MIRSTQQSDASAILAIVEQSGQFDADGLAHVKDMLVRHLAGEGDGIWLTADDGEPVGVAYCAPEPVASGTWNLLMLWTRSDRHGKGHGAALVKQVERALQDQAARLLIVETSGLPAFAAARSFYAKCGFVHEASIRNFFAAGDDKLVFTKSLAPAPSGH
jgi:GNAT superfamily N-acetyltransferase